MNITIPVRKAGRSIQVDLTRLVAFDPEQFDAIVKESPKLMYVLAYGLTQSLNDAHAADTKKTNATPEIIMAQVEKKLAAIYDGTIRVKGSGAAVNPVEREAMKIARKWWKDQGVGKQNAAIGKMRTRDSFAELEDEAIADAIMATYAKSAGVMEKAQAIVAVNAKKVDDDFDIESLMAIDESDETESE